MRPSPAGIPAATARASRSSKTRGGARESPALAPPPGGNPAPPPRARRVVVGAPRPVQRVKGQRGGGDRGGRHRRLARRETSGGPGAVVGVVHRSDSSE